jgi:hypothetical protein
MRRADGFTHIYITTETHSAHMCNYGQPVSSTAHPSIGLGRSLALVVVTGKLSGGPLISMLHFETATATNNRAQVRTLSAVSPTKIKQHDRTEHKEFMYEQRLLCVRTHLHHGYACSYACTYTV